MEQEYEPRENHDQPQENVAGSPSAQESEPIPMTADEELRRQRKSETDARKREAEQARRLKLRQRDERRTHVAKYYKLGWTARDIAHELNFSTNTIYSDIKILIRYWRMSAIRDIDGIRQVELEKIALMEREAWEAWERSKQDSQRTIQEMVKRADDPEGKGGAGNGRAQVLKETQTGDTRYLDVVQRCQERRAKLLGLDEPTKTITEVDATLNGTMPHVHFYLPDNGRRAGAAPQQTTAIGIG